MNRSFPFWIGITATIALIAVVGTYAVGGYFDQKAYEWHSGRANPPLVALYWSGDMGMRLGSGSAVISKLASQGIPVLAVSSPVVFAEQRDRAYVDAVVTQSVRDALRQSGASRVAVIGGSFGADILGVGLGRLPADLRARVASVVLMVPETDVYFRANPFGFSYRGPVAADPVHTIPLLHGLPVTCIYGTEETATLCREPFMNRARRVAVADGHRMLWHRETAVAGMLDAILRPPPSFR